MREQKHDIFWHCDSNTINVHATLLAGRLEYITFIVETDKFSEKCKSKSHTTSPGFNLQNVLQVHVNNSWDCDN